MKSLLLLTASGPLLILTSHDSLHDPKLLEQLKHKGIGKFVAFEVPVSLARERYGGHFQAVESNLHETDDLRVLDFNGQRVFQLFRFDELGAPILQEQRLSGLVLKHDPKAAWDFPVQVRKADSPSHSITSSARASNDGGMTRPSALAVLRLMTSSNWVGCSTGRSTGLTPARICQEVRFVPQNRP